MALQNLDYTSKPVTPERMRDCIDTILSMQNPNGGYASYELKRGSDRMEYLNAAEVFGGHPPSLWVSKLNRRRQYHGGLPLSRMHNLCAVCSQKLFSGRSNLPHGGSIVRFSTPPFSNMR